MDLEQRVQKIEERNAEVTADKAWETSFARMGLIVLFTYLIISLFIGAIGVPNPWLSGLVPAAGFLLSTLTMPFFKNLWLNTAKSSYPQLRRTLLRKVK